MSKIGFIGLGIMGTPMARMSEYGGCSDVMRAMPCNFRISSTLALDRPIQIRSFSQHFLIALQSPLAFRQLDAAQVWVLNRPVDDTP